MSNAQKGFITSYITVPIILAMEAPHPHFTFHKVVEVAVVGAMVFNEIPGF